MKAKRQNRARSVSDTMLDGAGGHVSRTDEISDPPRWPVVRFIRFRNWRFDVQERSTGSASRRIDDLVGQSAGWLFLACFTCLELFIGSHRNELHLRFSSFTRLKQFSSHGATPRGG